MGVMRHIVTVVAGTALAAFGGYDFYLGLYGELWQSPYLGWPELYVLRPFMIGGGVLAAAAGLYMGPLYRSRAARIWRDWRLTCAWEREQDRSLGKDEYAAMVLGDAENWQWSWRDSLRDLWSRRGCLWGAHNPDAEGTYLGGEDSPRRGVFCTDCGTFLRKLEPRVCWRPATIDKEA